MIDIICNVNNQVTTTDFLNDIQNLFKNVPIKLPNKYLINPTNKCFYQLTKFSVDSTKDCLNPIWLNKTNISVNLTKFCLTHEKI